MTIHLLDQSSAQELSQAFCAQGWHKPIEQYEQYLREQTKGEKTGLVCRVDGLCAGYLLIAWQSWYPPFLAAGIPEIMDLNVLMAFQGRGIASTLMDEAERRVFASYDCIGLTVGLTSNYGKAQRLYAKRGYIPDGRGIHYNGVFVEPGTMVQADDDLNLALTKNRID